jgi:hypothetical protein
MNKFVEGQKLATRSICDHNCIFTAKVIKVTAKTVTIDDSIYGVKRCKIHVDDRDGGEFIFPHGKHSMAPIFRAAKEGTWNQT